VSCSCISWAICKSAPRPRQITTPAPHHSVFYRLDALPAAQPTASKLVICNARNIVHKLKSEHWRQMSYNVLILCPRQLYYYCYYYRGTYKTSPPQSHLGRAHCYPHGRECTHLLRVLAVQCPLQTSPVTQPWVRYIHTTSVPWHIGPNHNLYHNANPTYHTNPITTTGWYSTGLNVAVGHGRVRVRVGDNNPQSSNSNNVKMHIACNSAYVQPECLNFTYAWQAIIVYFDAECGILMY